MASRSALVGDPGPTAGSGGSAMVRVDVLRKFTELVATLGGDPHRLLAAFQLDAAILEKPHALIPYRTHVHLLERAAAELDCPDFGMRLADLQGGAKVLGPLGIAMHNARTLREAFQYCAEHVQAFSNVTRIGLETDRRAASTLMRFEILLAGLPFQRQAAEQALLLVQHNVRGLSGDQVRAREVWFAHEPLAALATYRSYFDVPVKFGRAVNGAVFADGDLDVPIADGDPQLYELATSFIEMRYPPSEPVLSARVRAVVERLLLDGDCSFALVASSLGMHVRTLQRRLRAEGECFETIKDGVRRDIALRYLSESSLPLTRITEMLGYSETSVLSRSCYRWFSASPKQLRSSNARRVDRAAAEAAVA